MKDFPGDEGANRTEVRIDAAIVSVIVTTYRDGKPVQEKRSEPMKVFRAAHPDLWAALDIELANGSRQNHRPDTNGTRAVLRSTR